MMKQAAKRAVEILESLGVQYGDARAETVSTEKTVFRNGRLEQAILRDSRGLGVRAVVGGFWGSASCTGFDAGSAEAAAKRAYELARSAGGKGEKPLSPLAPQRGAYKGPVEEDPFDVPVGEKMALLDRASREAMKDQRVKECYAWLGFENIRRVLASTEGSMVESDLTFSEPFLMATAVSGGDAQSRSLQDGARIAGWEWIRQCDIDSWGEKAREEAIEKVLAPESPEGVMDLLLDGIHLSLTMHESVGHPTESDRVLGWESNMAGRSFLGIEDQRSAIYGSRLVNLVADNTLPYGLASWGWDDDGVPGQRWHLVKNGVFQEFGTVRETAPLVGRSYSRGCCRAMDYSSFPINRQPNFYLEPGPDGITPEDLMAGIRLGVMIEGRGSFSIDQRRINFQFGGDRFQLIRNGKPAGPLKKVIYRSETPRFWGSCDGIADRRWFKTAGFLTCGKGEPMQSARMTHGASWARFRNIRVGGGK
jgi:TldD protein